jgi:hypothetical protein
MHCHRLSLVCVREFASLMDIIARRADFCPRAGARLITPGGLSGLFKVVSEFWNSSRFGSG